MTLEEQYKKETGDESRYGEEIGIWGAAAGEYSKRYVAWLESTLARVTAERDELIDLINLAVDAIDSKQYPNTLGVMTATISRIEEGK
jgi:hypothetical protein